MHHILSLPDGSKYRLAIAVSAPRNVRPGRRSLMPNAFNLILTAIINQLHIVVDLAAETANGP